MAQTFQPGDKVAWQAGQGTTTGTVQQRVTASVEVDGHTVAAASDNPRYLVKNDSTGKVTGHQPDTLSPIEAEDQAQDKSESSPQTAEVAEQREQMQDKIAEFEAAVNMTAHEIEHWLATAESKSVGQKNEAGEIKGRKSGQHMVEILNKPKSNYTDADLQRIKKVVSYIHRHTAQRPSGDIANTPWRYSLMNWGHDPLKH